MPIRIVICPCSAAATRSAVEGAFLVDGVALDERGHDSGVADLAGPPIEQVAVEDDEVGRLPTSAFLSDRRDG